MLSLAALPLCAQEQLKKKMMAQRQKKTVSQAELSFIHRRGPLPIHPPFLFNDIRTIRSAEKARPFPHGKQNPLPRTHGKRPARRPAPSFISNKKNYQFRFTLTPAPIHTPACGMFPWS